MKDSPVKILQNGDQLRLLCLPHAGGNAYSFRPLAQRLPPRWQIVGIDPPGHGTNVTEPLHEFEDLVGYLLANLAPHFIPPFVLYGHSLGGLAAFRMAQCLQETGPAPSALIVSGSLPPHLQNEERNHWFEMSDREVIEDLERMQGLPEELLHNESFMEYLLPVIKADSRLLSTFQPIDTTPLQTPMLVFGGRQDAEVPIEKLEEWTQVGPRVQTQVLNGAHMFLHTEEAALAEQLEIRINQIVSSSSGPY